MYDKPFTQYVISRDPSLSSKAPSGWFLKDNTLTSGVFHSTKLEWSNSRNKFTKLPEKSEESVTKWVLKWRKLWPTMTSAFSLRPEFLNEKSLFLNGTKCRAKQRFQLRTFLKTLLASYAVQLMVNWFSSCVLLWRTDYRGSWLIVKVFPGVLYHPALRENLFWEPLSFCICKCRAEN